MDQFFKHVKTAEGGIFSFLIVFLGGYALLTLLAGFHLSMFFALLVPAAVLGLFFSRAAVLASLALTVFFERFYALQPLVVGDAIYKLYPIDIMLGAAFVSVFISWLKEKDRFRGWKTMDWLIFLFFAFVTIIFLGDFFWATDTSIATAFSTWKNYVFYGALYFLIARLFRTDEDIRTLSNVFFSGVAAALVFLAIGIIRGEGLWTEYTPLSTSGTRILAFPHAFYFSLAFVALMLAVNLWISDRVKRKSIVVFLGILAVGIMGSLMRHLWLGIAGAFLFGFLFFPYEFKKSFLRVMTYFSGAALLVGVMFFVGLSIFPGSDTTIGIWQKSGIVIERISSMNDPYDESLAWREAVWQSSLERFSDTPVFGVGFGARVPVELGEYRAFVEIRDMHNSWLAMLIQTGIVGTGIFLLFLSTLFFELFRMKTENSFYSAGRQVLLGLVVFQCLIFFSQPYLETNLLGIFFFVTLGLSRSIIDLGRKDILATHGTI